ncbi:ABC transporter substrate-binding protein [Alteromonas sediminis]|uniref:ABC transporter substrate-binding protein n=1 Tax=Alteromonas sediminis TaxID=2259342 RepID=A0A3N5Y833_9ALTE|nr:transporter substrate-binding domain-containing protein [Alteromonas sediminis]RPJ67079.1 ABC transporter substrate-binding protein [Alteromonas sediminis]
MFNRLIIWLCVFIVGTGSVAFAEEKPVVSAYAYHLKPPFIIDPLQESGLCYDYSRLLSELSDVEFFTLFIPRKRLNRLLSDGGFDGIVLGANPLWFKDADKKKYLWSDPLIKDRDEFISLKSSKFDYVDPKSLLRHSLAGVRGFYYGKVEKAKAYGPIKRFDTIGEKEVLDMVVKGRADIGIISRSTLNYMRSLKPSEYEVLYLSRVPHEEYSRYVMLPNKRQKLHTKIVALMRSPEYQARWKKLVAKYNLKYED